MFEARIQRVADHMKAQGLPQIIVTATTSVYYLTGLWIEPHERLLALLIREDGSRALFGNTMFAIEAPENLPLTLHSDGESPLLHLAEALAPGVVGVDKFWFSQFLLGLQALRGDCTFVLGSDPVDKARMRKDEAEIALLAQASQMNDAVMSKAIAGIGPGLTEAALQALVNQAYLSRGADGEGPQIICFGKNGADPHHSVDGTVLSPGDAVILDLYAPKKRYWCDMTRTVFYGSVTQKQQVVYELVKKANETAIAMIRPGVLPSQVDEAARDVIRKGGYGDYFTHRLGHGCGLDCHEPPSISQDTEAPLLSGMVFSVEPGIYLPGEFGVRIEDLVLVTETGCRVLNAYPKDLIILKTT